MAPTQVASTHGVSLALHDLGGDGPPALLVHATGFHGRVWAPLAAALPEVHAWAPDLRAHGDSVVPEGHELAWDRFADDVLAVVDHLRPDAPLVGIGHSKGGAALLLAEQRRPGTFRALWVYEPVVFPPDQVGPPGTPNPLSEGARKRRATFPSLDAAYENYASKPPMSTFDPAALRAYVDGGFRELPDGSVTLKCRPEDEARTYEMAGRADAFGHLGEVACPVLVLRGVALPFGPSAFADRVAAALPQGRLEAHDELGHFGPLEAPARMAASIRAIL